MALPMQYAILKFLEEENAKKKKALKKKQKQKQKKLKRVLLRPVIARNKFSK